MNNHLETYLYEKYPEFFVEKDWDIKNTCMCWGIQCGDGWFNLLDSTCMKVKDYLTSLQKSLQSFKFQSIKEKYGYLDIMHSLTDCKEDSCTFSDYQRNAIDDIIEGASSDSEYTCELCGSTRGARVAGFSYFQALCSYCYHKEHKDD